MTGWRPAADGAQPCGSQEARHARHAQRAALSGESRIAEFRETVLRGLVVTRSKGNTGGGAGLGEGEEGCLQRTAPEGGSQGRGGWLSEGQE